MTTPAEHAATLAAARWGSRRWPVEPLLAMRPPEDRLRERPEDRGHNTDCRWLARQVGVHPRSVYRWRHAGLTDTQADRAAIALGVHPLNVWHDWCDIDLDDEGTAA